MEISVLMVSPPDHWNLVIINALSLYVGSWGIPKVQHWSFLKAHCDTAVRSLPCPLVSTKVGNGVGKRHVITPGHLLDAGGNMGKRSSLPGRHVQEYLP